MPKEIPLTQGKTTIVDDEDFEMLNQFKWYYHRDWRSPHRGYAVRNSLYIKGEKRHQIVMHRLILNAPPGIEVDHINRNTLDNRRINLRLCSTKQNLFNREKKQNCISQYKGVTLRPSTGKWQACIAKNGQSFYLGVFESEIGAAKAYNEAAVKLFGRFAGLNNV